MQSTSPTPLGQPQLSFIREGQVKFTPAQANLVIKWCRYERQRDETKAKRHIATLAEDMRRGNWLPKSQLDFARLDGRLILVNGHHRMRAQMEAHKDVLWNIAVHECTSDAEVKSLYYRFDTNLRKRSASNIIDGIGFADDVGLSKQNAGALWRAAQFIADNMQFRRYSQADGVTSLLTDDRVAICHEYSQEAQVLGQILKTAPKPVQTKIRAASVFALAMVTLKAEPEIAYRFWKGLADDDGLTKGDARKTLLQDMQVRSGKSGLIAANLMAAAKAWNAFRADRSIQIIKVTGTPVPIDGTEYVVRA